MPLLPKVIKASVTTQAFIFGAPLSSPDKTANSTLGKRAHVHGKQGVGRRTASKLGGGTLSAKSEVFKKDPELIWEMF